MPTYQELLAQKSELDEQIEAARTAEVSAAVATVKQLISDFSLTAEDCGFSPEPKAKKDKPSAAAKVSVPKYVGPAGEAWTGRGRAPAWVVMHEAAGNSRESLLAH